MADADPYDLLRRARKLIEDAYSTTDGEEWLVNYEKLPGAELSKVAIRVLRDPHRRMRNTLDWSGQTQKLLKDGYLQKVQHISGSTSQRYTAIRLTKKGREALRLRADVED